jgi:hypothetical protein
MGNQTGNRSLGDFLQLRIGPQGEAEISYADSNDIDSFGTPEAMFVRQNSGPSVYTQIGTVSGTPAPTGGCVNDPARDATFDASGVVGANQPNLDLLQACLSQPDASHYQATMKVSDLTSLTPGAEAGGTTLIWQMQWHVPSATDSNGGALFFVYMESVSGQPLTCWAGQSANVRFGGGLELTYPGTTQLMGTACSFTAAAPGTITITVPTSAVSEPNPINSTLYSITASTQTLPSGNAETPPPMNVPTSGIVGGQLPNLIDVAPAFDFNPICQGCIPEAPWVPALVIPGVAMAGLVLAVQRRRRGDANKTHS